MYHVFPASFLPWCVATPLAKYVALSVWSFPILETFHIMGLTLLLGSVFSLNLTVLGVGVRMPGDVLAKQLFPWAVAGFLLMVGTGIPMFMSAAPVYGDSRPFSIKMTLLVTAIVVQTAIHRIPGSYAGSRMARIAACVSLFCWFGIAYAGRAIAFTNLLSLDSFLWWRPD
jgi:hypothetical protein